MCGTIGRAVYTCVRRAILYLPVSHILRGAVRRAVPLMLTATHARPNVPALFRANFAVRAGGR